MKTVYLELREFTPLDGKECQAASYPGPGLYLGLVWGVRKIISVGSGGCVMFADLPIGTEPASLEARAAPSSGVSETTLLKTIAILTGKSVAEVRL
jgi:hypothetical protein